MQRSCAKRSTTTNLSWHGFAPLRQGTYRKVVTDPVRHSAKYPAEMSLNVWAAAAELDGSLAGGRPRRRERSWSVRPHAVSIKNASGPPGVRSNGTAQTTRDMFTINKGNEYVINKLMPTRFLLCAVVMELAAEAEMRGVRWKWSGPRGVGTRRRTTCPTSKLADVTVTNM